MDSSEFDTIDTLVFGGGGVRGVAYLGALLAIRDRFDKDLTNAPHLTCFAGSSIGALVALMFTCGWTLEEMRQFSETTNFENLLFDVDILQAGLLGLQDGSILRGLVTAVLQAKGIPLDITFDGLYKLFPKKLVVTVSDLTCVGIQQLCYETVPNAPIVEAVMGSMTLPLLFQPVKWENRLWVDGGLCDNFPMHLFKPETTLGFYVKYYVDPKHNLGSAFGQYGRLISMLSMNQDRMQHEACKVDQQKVIQIDVGPVHAVDSLTTEKVTQIIFKAYRDVIALKNLQMYSSETPLKMMPSEDQERYHLPRQFESIVQRLQK